MAPARVSAVFPVSCFHQWKKRFESYLPRAIGEFWFIAGTDGKKQKDSTLKQLFQSFGSFGFDLTDKNYFFTENTLQGGAIAARHILNMREKPELVITLNTTLAFGAIPLLARNRFIFTRDAELLSFGGVEDTLHVANYIPSLSLIAVPTEEIAMECFSIALQLAEGSLFGTASLYLPFITAAE